MLAKRRCSGLRRFLGMRQAIRYDTLTIDGCESIMTVKLVVVCVTLIPSERLDGDL